MVNVVQIFAEGSWQDVVVIFLIGRVSPPQNQEDRQRGTEAEKVLDSERKKKQPGSKDS